MWEVRVQMNRVNPNSQTNSLECGAVYVDTQQEAEEWWTCRTQQQCAQKRVHTMWNPEGQVVRVQMA
tara:strand:+ start:3221 stop:3421 length:201 start_codon:yes stop_codon:yes gene_type:complete